MDFNSLSTSRLTTSSLSPLEAAFALEREINRACPPSKRLVLPLRHFFADGVYVREIFMPAGATVVGKIHKHEHVAMLLKGDISIYDETGLHRIQGPCTFISKPGIKRALYIHEDTIFTTIHRLRDPEERRLEVLEQEYAAGSVEEWEKWIVHSGEVDSAETIHYPLSTDAP